MPDLIKKKSCNLHGLFQHKGPYKTGIHSPVSTVLQYVLLRFLVNVLLAVLFAFLVDTFKNAFLASLRFASTTCG